MQLFFIQDRSSQTWQKCKSRQQLSKSVEEEHKPVRLENLCDLSNVSSSEVHLQQLLFLLLNNVSRSVFFLLLFIFSYTPPWEKVDKNKVNKSYELIFSVDWGLGCIVATTACKIVETRIPFQKLPFASKPCPSWKNEQIIFILTPQPHSSPPFQVFA